MGKAKIVTIFGGSGFIGRYVARRMARAGWRVRVAVRRPNEAGFVRTYGAVGQVEPVFANVRDDASVRAQIRGSDAVVNLVAIMVEKGKQTFEALHVEAAARIARIAAEEGVQNLVHVSALGADPTSPSRYASTKGRGEIAVREQFPGAVILRPSVVFGPEDKFFNRFASMVRISPVLPIFGGNTRFQPVYVDDVAAAAEMGATGRAEPGIYELGGPDVETMRELMHRMLRVIHRRRLVVNLPFFVADIMGRSLDILQFLSIGLFTNNILTADQAILLRRDNVVGEGARGFHTLGLAPTAMDAVLDSYLYRYRPLGQYHELTQSARALRTGGLDRHP